MAAKETQQLRPGPKPQPEAEVLTRDPETGKMISVRHADVGPVIARENEAEERENH